MTESQKTIVDFLKTSGRSRTMLEIASYAVPKRTVGQTAADLNTLCKTGQLRRVARGNHIGYRLN